MIASLRGKMAVLLVEQFLDFALAVADHCYVMERAASCCRGAPDAGRALLKRHLAV